MELKLLTLCQEPTEPVRSDFKYAKAYDRALIKYSNTLEKYNRQLSDALLLSTYFNKAWQRCRKKETDSFTHFRITRLRSLISRSNWGLLHAIANMWFEQKMRGNSLSGKCSAWVHRKTPHINNKMRALLLELSEFNIDALNQTRVIMKQPDEVSVEVTFKFEFKTKEQADIFRTLIGTHLMDN